MSKYTHEQYELKCRIWWQRKPTAPYQIDCPSCNGGVLGTSFWTDPEELSDCPKCKGTGKLPDPKAVASPAVPRDIYDHVGNEFKNYGSDK